MINLLWSGVLMLLLVSGCGWDGTPTRKNDFIPLKSIEITAVSSTIAAKTSIKLSVKGVFLGGQPAGDITDQAVWSSDAPNVAGFVTASTPNLVSGVAPGTATLKANVRGVSSTFVLTVSSATINTMTITPANPSVASGLTTQFAVNGTFSDGSTQDLTFEAAWTSSIGTIATVSDDPASKGLAKGLTAGTATITASFDDLTATTQLTVTSPQLLSITVTPANSSINGSSKTVNFKATGRYSDGTAPDVTATADWDSSQKTVATITAGGVATTVAAGTTSISATLNGVIGRTDLTVTALVLRSSGLKIAPVNLTLNVGAKTQLAVTATFTDGTTQDVTPGSEWSSFPTTTATVGNVAADKGLVTGVAAGVATVTAAFGGQSVTAAVTIR